MSFLDLDVLKAEAQADRREADLWMEKATQPDLPPGKRDLYVRLARSAAAGAVLATKALRHAMVAKNLGMLPDGARQGAPEGPEGPPPRNPQPPGRARLAVVPPPEPPAA